MPAKPRKTLIMSNLTTKSTLNKSIASDAALNAGSKSTARPFLIVVSTFLSCYAMLVNYTAATDGFPNGSFAMVVVFNLLAISVTIKTYLTK